MNNKTSSNLTQKKPDIKYIPPEVWTHILASLPLKSVLRFKSVSKSWRSIIDHPDFHNLHFHLYYNNIRSHKTDWSTAVYCLILGTNPNIKTISGFINRIWKKYDHDNIYFLTNGMFVVRFKTIESQQTVLNNDHSLFDNKPLIVRDRLMSREDVKTMMVPIWIRLYELKLKFWGEGCLKKIAGIIGRAIKFDNYTREKTRLGFARILVEVRVGQEFPEKIEFIDERGGIQEVRVGYDWKPVVCSNCSGFGHGNYACKKMARVLEL